MLSMQQKSTRDDGPVAIAEERSVPTQGAVQTADMLLRPAQKSGENRTKEGKASCMFAKTGSRCPGQLGEDSQSEPEKPGNGLTAQGHASERMTERKQNCWESVFIFLSLVKPRAFFYQELSAL